MGALAGPHINVSQALWLQQPSCRHERQKCGRRHQLHERRAICRRHAVGHNWQLHCAVDEIHRSGGVAAHCARLDRGEGRERGEKERAAGDNHEYRDTQREEGS